MAGRNDDKFRCSFCGKTQDQVRKLIAGPNGAYICDECVDICADIIEEEYEDEPVGNSVLAGQDVVLDVVLLSLQEEVFAGLLRIHGLRRTHGLSLMF